jgi:hypothetical protein
MVNTSCNVQHVDHTIVKSILHLGTKQKSGNGRLSDKWSPPVLEWYSAIVQTTCHLGGFGITPKRGLWHRSLLLSHGTVCHMAKPAILTRNMANGQDLAHPQTWRSPNLIALNDMHACLFQEFQCVELNPQDANAGRQRTSHCNYPLQSATKPSRFHA